MATPVDEEPKDPFMDLLVEISKDITPETFREVKNLCSFIPESDINKMKSPVELFYKLYQMNKISGTDTSLVEQLLCKVDRQDLVEKYLKGNKVPRELHLRGPEVLKVYEKACAEGKKKVFRARVMFVGHQGVGKTSLARCLRGESFDINEPSTNGIETDPATCVIDVSNWKPNKAADGSGTTSDDSYNHSVAKHMLLELSRSDSQNTTDDASQQSEARQDDQKVDGDTTIRSQVEDTTPAHSVEEASPSVEIPEEIAELLKKLKEDEEDDAAEPEIILYFWDFGGQSVFHPTHQVFLTNRAIYIMVVDCSKPLDSIVDPETRQGVHENVTEQKNMTVKDYIHFWLNSIHAHASLPGQQESAASPVVIIVATHKDQLQSKSPSETEAEIEKYLTELRKYLDSHVTAANEHVLPKIYVVDNSHRLRTGEDDPQLVSLKEELSQVARGQEWMGEEIPIKWLQLEEELKKLKEKGKKHLPLIELEKKADTLGIKDKDELKIILQFYHDLGDIIYFNEPHLQNLIILDPQWLVDVFKSVITVKAYQDQDRECRKYWKRLDDEGILETQLIDTIWRKLGLLQHKDLLLDIMQKFDLICECKSTLDEVGISCHGDSSGAEKSVCTSRKSSRYGDLLHDGGKARSVCTRYFVPSLLKTEKDVNSVTSATTSAEPLYFLFNEGFLPDGLYHRLVTRCLRDWPHNTKLNRNRVLCELDEDHDLLLIKEGSKIKMNVIYNHIEDQTEGQVPVEDVPSPDWCNKVRQVVQDHLEELIKQWVPGLAFRTTFKKDEQSEQSPFIEVTEEVVTQGSVKCSAHHRIGTEPIRRWFAVQGDSRPKPTPVINRPTSRGEPEEKRLKLDMDPLMELFVYISQQITDENLRDLKLLCSNRSIPERDIDKVKTAAELFQILFNMDKISENDISVLEDLLCKVCRQDLVNYIKEKKGHCAFEDDL